MKRVKQLEKGFGIGEEQHFPAFLPKISNVQVARALFGNARGCAHCFPHGPEVDNATMANVQRNWKRFRRLQWKS